MRQTRRNLGVVPTYHPDSRRAVEASGERPLDKDGHRGHSCGGLLGLLILSKVEVRAIHLHYIGVIANESRGNAGVDLRQVSHR